MTAVNSDSPLFQGDSSLLTDEHDWILDSPHSTSVAVTSQLLTVKQPEEFLDDQAFSSPLVPGAFTYSLPCPDPYLSDRSSSLRSLAPLTPLPLLLSLQILLPTSYPSASPDSSMSSSSESSPSLSFLFQPSFDCSFINLQTASVPRAAPQPVLRVPNLNLVFSSTATMADPFQMPLQGTQDAPNFDGKSAVQLLHYLKDIEFLGTSAGLTDEEQIRVVIDYADLEEAEVWQTLPEAFVAIPDWQNFVTAVKHLYPGCEGDGWYC